MRHRIHAAAIAHLLRPIGAGILAAATLTAPVQAQNDKMVAIAIPAQPDAIELGTGPLPGATAPESWHSQYGSMFARNVTVATLTPFLPDPSKATGAAVIVAPGGGFRTLSMENEGWNVARALADKGVAAFVLKYRLNQTPADLDGLRAARMRRACSPAPARPPPRPSPGDDGRPHRAADRRRQRRLRPRPRQRGEVARRSRPHRHDRLLRRRDAHHGHRRSHGQRRQARVHRQHLRPAGRGRRPADAPPLFAAVAADDPLFGNGDFGLIESWRKAKRPVEFHYYEQGGHGFGMYPKETTSTGWFDAFVRWLGMHGLLKRRG